MSERKQRKILMIAHHFPPRGGPGVGRALEFVKHLHAMGYKLYVLTVALDEHKNASYPRDHSLLEEIPKDVEFIRIPTHEPSRLKNFFVRLHLFRLLWVFAYPLVWENSALWPYYCLKPMKKLIEEEEIDLIWTTSGPFTSAQLGSMLRKRTKAKWICDLRDPFADTYYFTFPSKFHWYASRWMEKVMYRRADRMVVVSPGMKRQLAKRNILPQDKIEIITNGYAD